MQDLNLWAKIISLHSSTELFPIPHAIALKAFYKDTNVFENKLSSM
jgi:hypothetical protein